MAKKKKQNKDPQSRPFEKTKAVGLPLNEQEQAFIERWQNEQTGAKIPFKFAAEITSTDTRYSMKTTSGRGSEQEQIDLGLASLCAATGAKSASFASLLYCNCTTATGMVNRENPEQLINNSNAILDALYAMKPQDEFEGMLITQLIALHFQSMEYLSQAGNKNAPQQARDVYINRSTKLGRLFNEKLEALMRYRRKGAQQVVVQHVNVEQGGQAIVGNVQTGGGGDNRFQRGSP